MPDHGYSEYYEHPVMAGERLDNIAYQYYSDPYFWDPIMAVNPELAIAGHSHLTPGIILKVPVIDFETEETTGTSISNIVPWRTR